MLVLTGGSMSAAASEATVVDELRARLGAVVTEAGPTRIEPNIDCGRHAMAAVQLALGLPVDWDTLQASLVPQRTGSSMQQVQAYAASQGLYALPVQLRSSDLPRLRYPAVLHVRKGGDPADGPNHFMVTLPSPVAGVVAFDPPRHLEVIEARELDPVWEGRALVIAPEPIDVGDVLAPATPVRPAMAGLAGVAAAAAGVMGATRLSRARRVG